MRLVATQATQAGRQAGRWLGEAKVSLRHLSFRLSLRLGYLSLGVKLG